MLLVAGILAAATGLLLAPPPWNPEATEALNAARLQSNPPPVQACVGLILWPVCAGILILLAALLATLHFWGTRSPALTTLPTPHKPGRGVLIVLCILTVVAIVPRVPRLSHSFWNDEETTMQDYAWGKWKQKKDASWRFRATPWEETLFYNRGGSNHVLNSILTRTTLAVADTVDGAPRGHFSESLARIVPFLASLATIFLFGWLLARAGYPVAAVVASLVLAVHPWFLRYSTEIRGYSVMMLAIVGALACLLAALRTGQRRAWAGFALCEAAMLLCFPGALYMAVALNAVAVVFLVTGHAPADKRRAVFLRLTIWNLLAALPVAVIFAPSLPQFAYYLEEGKRMIAFGKGWGWERDFLTHLMAGIPPNDPAPGESHAMAFRTLAAWQRHAILPWLPLAAAVGAGLFLVRGTTRDRLFLLPLLLAPLLSWAHNRMADNPAMPWYLLFTVLTLAAGLGLAAQTTWKYLQAARTSGRRAVFALFSALLAGVLISWLAMVLPIDHRLATIPRHPLRETATAMRGIAPTYGESGDQHILTATFGTSAKRLRSYDPAVIVFKTLDDFDELLTRADREQRPVIIAFCGRRVAQLSSAESPLRQILEKVEAPSSSFTHVTDIWGMEELFSYHIYRREPAPHQPGGSESAAP